MQHEATLNLLFTVQAGGWQLNTTLGHAEPFTVQAGG